MAKVVRKYIEKTIKSALRRGLPKNDIGDALYGRFLFYLAHGRLPGPVRRFNDELFRVRTQEARDPLRVFVTDKELLKAYVAGRVGDAHNVPTVAVLRSAEEARRFVFPRRCVVKPTHVSGKVAFRLDGEPLDLDRVCSWFDFDYYRRSREGNYRTLRPKLIVEPLIFDRDDNFDYKIFCYNGVPKLIQVDVDRYGHHRRCLYDADWVLQPYALRRPRYDAGVEQPANLAEMLEVAARLSRDFGLVRIDLYSDGARCLVGEITNCHGGACECFIPPEAEDDASALIFS